jgi:hypothetical protein
MSEDSFIRGLLGQNECSLLVEGHKFAGPGAEGYGLNVLPTNPSVQT